MHLYLATIERFACTDPALLDETKASQYARAKSEHRKRELRAGAGLLRYALADFGCDVGEAALPVLYTEAGKPFLSEGPSFSLSHSGELIVCAVSAENVGVDIERVSRFAETRIAKKILSDPELLCMQRLDADAKMRFLADRWTAKEAVSKLIGQGLAVSFSEICAEEYRTTVWRTEHNGESYYIRTAMMR